MSRRRLRCMKHSAQRTKSGLGLAGVKPHATGLVRSFPCAPILHHHGTSPSSQPWVPLLTTTPSSFAAHIHGAPRRTRRHGRRTVLIYTTINRASLCTCTRPTSAHVLSPPRPPDRPFSFSYTLSARRADTVATTFDMAANNGTPPDLGRPQSEARAWFEPLVSARLNTSFQLVARPPR